MNTDKVQTSYTFWNSFRNCRQACKKRFIDEVAPIEQRESLNFGSLIHTCLEHHHKGVPFEDILHLIDGWYTNLADEAQKKHWHLAHAMMRGYVERNPEESFEPARFNGRPALEVSFQGPIINPATGAESRTFVLGGKVDGIVVRDGLFWLLEHKTASTINAAYLERLWTDFQILLYSWYIEQSYEIEIAGVIYNILGKAGLSQKEGESETEFELRKEGMKCPNRAKRKLPESDEDYATRLADWYSRPEAFHREDLYIDHDQVTELRAELWELAQSFLHARRTNSWFKNTSYCFRAGGGFGTCEYFPLCSSGDNPNVLDNLYETRPPHGEIDFDEAAVGGTVTMDREPVPELTAF